MKANKALAFILLLALLNNSQCFDIENYIVEDPLQCSGTFIQCGLNNDQRRSILHHHNRYRQLIASNREEGQLPAADMNYLTWDYDLEKFATKWLEGCQYEHSNKRDYGENIYQEKFDSEAFVPQKPIQEWFDELLRSGFHGENLWPFQYTPGTLEYSQLVWAKTTKVGCALVSFEKNGQNYRIFQCNYDTGNVEGGHVYQDGPGCTQCLVDCHQHDDYNLLCGNPKFDGIRDQDVTCGTHQVQPQIYNQQPICKTCVNSNECENGLYCSAFLKRCVHNAETCCDSDEALDSCWCTEEGCPVPKEKVPDNYLDKYIKEIEDAKKQKEKPQVVEEVHEEHHFDGENDGEHGSHGHSSGRRGVENVFHFDGEHQNDGGELKQNTQQNQTSYPNVDLHFPSSSKQTQNNSEPAVQQQNQPHQYGNSSDVPTPAFLGKDNVEQLWVGLTQWITESQNGYINTTLRTFTNKQWDQPAFLTSSVLASKLGQWIIKIRKLYAGGQVCMGVIEKSTLQKLRANTRVGKAFSSAVYCTGGLIHNAYGTVEVRNNTLDQLRIIELGGSFEISVQNNQVDIRTNDGFDDLSIHFNLSPLNSEYYPFIQINGANTVAIVEGQQEPALTNSNFMKKAKKFNNFNKIQSSNKKAKEEQKILMKKVVEPTKVEKEVKKTHQPKKVEEIKKVEEPKKSEQQTKSEKIEHIKEELLKDKQKHDEQKKQQMLQQNLKIQENQAAEQKQELKDQEKKSSEEIIQLMKQKQEQRKLQQIHKTENKNPAPEEAKVHQKQKQKLKNFIRKNGGL